MCLHLWTLPMHLHLVSHPCQHFIRWSHEIFGAGSLYTYLKHQIALIKLQIISPLIMCVCVCFQLQLLLRMQFIALHMSASWCCCCGRAFDQHQESCPFLGARIHSLVEVTASVNSILCWFSIKPTYEHKFRRKIFDLFYLPLLQAASIFATNRL